VCRRGGNAHPLIPRPGAVAAPVRPALSLLEDAMPRPTGPQPRVSVKRRGSKRHAAEAEAWRDTEAPRRDNEGGRGGGWGDGPSPDPGHAGKARALAQ
jgi:hypothetical protein